MLFLNKQTNKLGCLGLAAATERVAALSSAPAAEFMGSCHSAPFKSILSPSSSDAIKKRKEVRDFPSEWDLAGLLKDCEKAHTAFQVVERRRNAVLILPLARLMSRTDFSLQMKQQYSAM